MQLFYQNNLKIQLGYNTIISLNYSLIVFINPVVALAG